MVTTKLNLSMTEPSVRQIYAKQGDTGRVLDITLDQTPEDGTLRILRPDGVEVTSEAVTGGEISESGETVSFESFTEADVTELTVGIEPVQDLNGFGKPWVGGAGKNLLPPFSSFTENGITATVANDGTITLNGTATANVNKQVTVNAPAGDYCLSLNNDVAVGTSANTTVYFYAVDGGGSWVMNPLCNVRNAFGRGTSANGITVVRMTINSGVTLNNFVIKPQLELGSTATSYEPYSNICPITGHDEVTVTRTGKNLLNPEDLTLIVHNSYVATPNYSSVGKIPVKPNTGYTISFGVIPSDSADARVFGFNSSGERTLLANTFDGSASFTTQADTELISFYYKTSQTLTTPTDAEPQLELGSTRTTYEPYQGSTYTTSLGQTVYGGTLDLVTGVLTVDSRYLTVDDFTEFNGGVSGGGLHWVNVPKSRPAGVNDDTSTNVCSHAPYSSNSDTGWGSRTPIYNVNSSGYPARIYVASASLADFRTEYATLQAVYKLATPQTYQLTAQQIKTLVGTNNVWASSGDIVSVKFTYGGLLSELPSDATSIVGKCYCDIEQNGVSSMPFTLNVKKNERAT